MKESREEAFQLPHYFQWKKAVRIHAAAAAAAANTSALLQIFLCRQVTLKAASAIHMQHAYVFKLISRRVGNW